MKKTLLLFIVITSLVSATHARSYTLRSPFLYGYLVLKAGDTLRGRILPTSVKFKLYNTRTRKVTKYKIGEVTAYKYGRHSYEMIEGQRFRILLDGPVKYYVKETVNYALTYRVETRYYCVKRRDEANVTVLFTQKRKFGGFDYPIDNIVLCLAAEIATELAVDAAIEKAETDQVSIFKNMRKVAATYFDDHEELVKDIEAGKYDGASDVRELVKRYNFFLAAQE